MRRPRTANALRGAPSSLCDIIQYGYFKQVRLLVRMGTDLECRDPLTRRTPLMMCALMEPAEWGASIAMTLLEAGVKACSVDSRGHNVLHLACMWCRERLVRVLLRAIDFDLGRQDKDGNTALHLAAMSGDVSVTQLVAQAFRRYCVNLNKTNSRGMTACQEALRAGYTTCAHAINFALAVKRPGSAIKDVRFGVPQLDSSTACSSANSNNKVRANEDEKRPRSGIAAKENHHNISITVNSNDSLNDSANLGTGRNVAMDKENLPVVNRTNCSDCGVDNPAPTEDSNDSVFLENVSPIREVVRSVSTPRSRSAMRSPRPMTAAFLTRQDSYSTLTSLEEKRSVISYPGRSDSRAQKRKFQNPLYFYGYKKDTDVIQCAPENDFRNTAEFVCKIVRLPPGMTTHWPLEDTIDCNGPWMSTSVSPDSQPDQAGTKDGWRHDLKSIFKVYEHQCSPSWRSGRKLELRPVTPDLNAQEEWEKGRRGRRQSITSRTHVPNMGRRSSVAMKPKRLNSMLSGHGRSTDGGLDTSRDPSNERITSPLPGGRRRSSHQLDISLGSGPRLDSISTSAKSKMENNMETNITCLPTLSEQVSEGGLFSSSRPHETGSTTENSGENSNLQQPSADVRNIRPKSSKGMGKSVAEINSSGREDLRVKRHNSSKTRMNVPTVNEILVQDQITSNEIDVQSVDTSRLSVPDPFDDDDGEGQSDNES